MHAKFTIQNTKYHFTCGESNLLGNIVNCPSILLLIVETLQTHSLHTRYIQVAFGKCNLHAPGMQRMSFKVYSSPLEIENVLGNMLRYAGGMQGEGVKRAKNGPK